MTNQNASKRPRGRLSDEGKSRERPRNIDPFARENQLIAAAIDLAEEQIRKGTATSQVITHFLKLGTEREQLEKERLRNENKLLIAKVDQIADQKAMMQIYAEALEAMNKYAGNSEQLDYDPEDLVFDDDD